MCCNLGIRGGPPVLRRLNILAVLGLIRWRNAVQAALTRLEWQSSGRVRRVILGSSIGQFGFKRGKFLLWKCYSVQNDKELSQRL